MKKYRRSNESRETQYEINLDHWSKKVEQEALENIRLAEEAKKEKDEQKNELKKRNVVYEIKRRPVETRKIKEYKELYHQLRFADLFLLWRDGVIPMSLTTEVSDEFTQAETNSVLTFWHKDKILGTGPFCYEAVAILKPEDLSEDFEVKEGDMYYQIADPYEGTRLDGLIPEIYVSKQIKLEELNSIETGLNSINETLDKKDNLEIKKSIEIFKQNPNSIDGISSYIIHIMTAIIHAERGVTFKYDQILEIPVEERIKLLEQMYDFIKWRHTLKKVEQHTDDGFHDYEYYAKEEKRLKDE